MHEAGSATKRNQPTFKQTTGEASTALLKHNVPSSPVHEFPMKNGKVKNDSNDGVKELLEDLEAEMTCPM